MKYYKYILLAVLATGLCACNNSTEESAGTSEPESESGVSDVTLTKEQVKKLNVTVGKLQQHAFSGEIEANGTIAIMPQSEALVSSFIGANVKDIVVKEGQRVGKGQTLAVVSHPDLLDMQSRYLSAYNKLEYAAQEFGRQQKLYGEKIGSGKDFQRVKSEYQALKAEVQTSGAQLQMLGISLQSVRSGATVTAVAIKSPIGGVVEKINVKTGQYVDSQTPMFRVINTNNLYADLKVFEKDAQFVKAGQEVTLALKSSTGAVFEGKVASVGQTFEGDTRAVSVRVSIEGAHDGLVPGMYVCGHIAANAQQLAAVSTEGIVDEDGKSYVFAVKESGGKVVFSPIEVKRGREEKNFVEIETSLPADKVIAQDNAYYIMSEMKKSETGEE